MLVHRRAYRFAGPALLSISMLVAGCGQGEVTQLPGADSATEDMASEGTVEAPRDLSGVWWSGEFVVLENVGQLPELLLTPAGEARYAETRPEMFEIAATTDLADMRRCISFGVPRIWMQPFPFKIIQTPEQIALVYEHNHVYRLIDMVGEMPSADEVDFNFMGHSVGHWDGDTLVIESGLFKSGMTVLDEDGMPHTEQLTTTERIRKLPNGNLEVVATMEDPEFYVEPWTMRFEYESRPDVQLMEYVCGFGVFETRYEPAQ